MNIQHKKFVLCVDDDINDRRVISEAIKDINPSVGVVEVNSGRDAFQFLQEAKEIGVFPCLIILDTKASISKSKEMLSKIKRDEALRLVPLVVLTNSSEPPTEIIENQIGFFRNSSDFDTIKANIKELLSPCSD